MTKIVVLSEKVNPSQFLNYRKHGDQSPPHVFVSSSLLDSFTAAPIPRGSGGNFSLGGFDTLDTLYILSRKYKVRNILECQIDDCLDNNSEAS